MPFRLSALPEWSFAPLFALDDDALGVRRARRARRGGAQPDGGYPSRVSLRDAEPGEMLLLIHHEHQSGDSPFRASHAIYVREGAAEARPAPGEVPDLFRTRLLSLRGFDAEAMLQAAEVADGAALEPAIEVMFATPAVAYIHLRFAGPGCYAAGVDRV